MSSRVGQLVGFVVALRKGDEDAEIVLAGHHLDACASELCRDLVKASGVYSALGAADVECRDGRVVRSLLGEVRDSHSLVLPVEGLVRD